MSDREIRRAVRAGACSTRDVAEACGAGSACGGCRPSVAAILAESESAPQEHRASLAGSPEAVLT